ncbi:MAG: hypothetical protein ACRCZW_01455 [Lactobacillaceae bacterium]
MSPNDRFDKANRNFKKVYNNKEFKHREKFKYLDYWMLSKSNYLLNNDRVYTNNKKVFNRGALINVDFGVNVGTELSGNHFAIVLNKKDSRKNDKLTVIPLSSHEHPHCVTLTDTIRDTSFTKINELYAEIFAILHAKYIIHANRLKYLYKNTSRLEKVKFKEDIERIIGHKLDLSSIDQEDIVIPPDPINDISEGMISIIPLIKKSQELYNKYEDPNDFLEHCSKINGKKLPDLILNPTEFQSSIELISKVFTAYTRYNKKTYAKIEDITTISKMRTQRINKFDPIGDIRVSNEVLNKIENEIKLCFFKNK